MILNSKKWDNNIIGQNYLLSIMKLINYVNLQ